MPHAQDVTRKVIGLIEKLLYFQGLWYEPPEPDLEFYLQFYSPRIAHLILEHRYLRLTLKFLRKVYPWTLILPVLCQVFVLFPVGIYIYWDNKGDVLTNFYLLIVFGLTLLGVMSLLFQKEQYKNVLGELKEMSRPEKIDNGEQKAMLNKTNSLCYGMTKYLHLIVVPLLALALTAAFIVYFIPNRLLYTREWYPWDTDTSPAYELTMFLKLEQSCFLFMTANTLISAIISLLALLITHYQILRNKIENIRTLAITRIKESKLEESRRLAGVQVAVVTDHGGHSRARVPHFVPRLHQTQAGRAAHNARRLKCLHLLQPLYATGSTVVRRTLGDATDTTRPAGLNRSSPVDRYPAFCRLSRAKKERRNNTKVERMSSLKVKDLERTHQVKDLEGKSHQVKDLEGISPQQLDREMQSLLREYLKLHTRLLRITETLGSLMNIYLIGIFLVNIVTLGITVLITSAQRYDVRDLIVVIISVEITGLYLMHNYLANVITQQGLEISEAIYFTDWTGTSPSFKKSLLIMMIRANQPVLIKPTGLDPLSLTNFSEVLIKAYKMTSTLNSFAK